MFQPRSRALVAGAEDVGALPGSLHQRLGDNLVPPPLWHCFGVFPRNCIVFGWCFGHRLAWMGLLRVPPAEPPVLLPPRPALP